LLKVEVKFYAMLREATGRRKESVELAEKSTVGDLVSLLSERYGGDLTHFIYDDRGRVRNYLSFMLNGYNIYSLDGFDTLLSENDVVAILPPVGGG